MTNTQFTEGDFIEVTPEEGSPDFGVLRGTALSSGGVWGGTSVLSLRLSTGDSSRQTVTLNSNFVNVKNLFSADHARGMVPPTA